MTCCGNRRAAATAASDTVASRAMPAQPIRHGLPGNRAVTSVPTSAPGAAAAGSGSVMVRYLETSPIRVHGPVTGRLYEFSGQQPLQVVERGDADALTRTRFFHRAS
jgi:hypothetical protein